MSTNKSAKHIAAKIVALLTSDYSARITIVARVTACSCCGVLADRERELLEIKGPCSSSECRLHYAHSGPCDTRPREIRS